MSRSLNLRLPNPRMLLICLRTPFAKHSIWLSHSLLPFSRQTRMIATHSLTMLTRKQSSLTRADRHSPIIHAELAMLSSIEAGTIKAFPYIGVSKLSCLMCSSYIEAYSQTATNRISVRGCHGKVYPSWAWPTMLGTHHERIRSIFLEKIREELKQDFERFTAYRRTRRQSDSSVGSTSEMECAITMTPENFWEQLMGGV
jgi:hypothetical protein